MESKGGKSKGLIDSERAEKIRNWKIRNDKLSEKLVDKAEVERDLTAMIYNMNRRFDASDAELAARVIGKTAGQARDLLRENRRKIFLEVCTLAWDRPMATSRKESK